MRILVIDDELPARKTIIKSLEELGYTDISQAKNGIEAFDLIQQIKPDIVLADIRMPGMDGIELLSKVKETVGDMIFIFISGYDLFEYARKAVSLGAFNYLLKPVDRDELKTVLDRAVQSVIKHNNEKISNSMLKIKVNQGFDHMKKDFVQMLLMRKEPYDNYIFNKLDEFDIKFPYELLCTIMINIDDSNSSLEQLSYRDTELSKFTIENISTEYFNGNKITAYPFNTENGVGYLLNFSHESPCSPQQELYELCCKIQNYLNQYFNYSITIGIGSVINTNGSLNKSYETAYKSLSQRLIKGNNKVICYRDTAIHKESYKMVDPNLEKEFKSAFEQGNSKTALELLKSLYLQFCSADSIDSEMLMKLNLQLIMLFNRILKEMSLSSEDILGDEYALYNEVKACSNIEGIVKWFEHKLQLCFDAIKSIIECSQKKVSDKAKEYIYTCNGDVTLEAVAEYVHLNPSYFSKVFKQETGENFIDYIVNLKVNKAKELLKSNTYKASEICKMAGFNDVKHFYKVFKKHTGYTPNEYRDIWFSNRLPRKLCDIKKEVRLMEN